jgi:hypothetical protein
MCQPNQSKTIGALALALSHAQAEMEGARKDAKNPHLRNTYADLASCWDACRGPLGKNGLAVIQTTETLDGDRIKIVSTLAHESGEWIRGELTIPANGNKGVNPAQAMGSAISYGRRYGLSAIVGICSADDDGNASSGNRPKKASISEQDLTQRIQAAATTDQLNQLYAAHKDAFSPAIIALAGARKKEIVSQTPPPPKDPITPDQLKRLQAEFSQAGYDRDERLAEISGIVGHEVKSANDLSKQEAGKVIEAMDQKLRGAA